MGAIAAPMVLDFLVSDLTLLPSGEGRAGGRGRSCRARGGRVQRARIPGLEGGATGIQSQSGAIQMGGDPDTGKNVVEFLLGRQI